MTSLEISALRRRDLQDGRGGRGGSRHSVPLGLWRSATDERHLLRPRGVETRQIGEELYSRPPQAMRYKGFSLGYAKSHGVIFSDDVGRSIILWTSGEEKERRLRQALARRKIPYDPKDFRKLERILRDHDNLMPLRTPRRRRRGMPVRVQR